MGDAPAAVAAHCGEVFGRSGEWCSRMPGHDGAHHDDVTDLAWASSRNASKARHPYQRGQVVEILKGKRAGQRHPVLDVYLAYEEGERAGVSIRDEDTELFYGLDEVSSVEASDRPSDDGSVTDDFMRKATADSSSDEPQFPRTEEYLRLLRIEQAAKAWDALFVWTEPFEGYDEEKALHRALVEPFTPVAAKEKP